MEATSSLSPSLSKEDAAPAAVPEKKVIRASDVVATGASPQFIQLPSPVYLAEWISPTHVVIGAGGGGSRFGMVNVLVMLSIHTECSTGRSGGPSPAAVKLTAAQQQAVKAAAAKSSSKGMGTGPSSNADGLWHFVTALDLGANVPWCTSGLLPWTAADSEGPDGAAATTAEKAHFVLSQAQRATLRTTVGLLALSSIKTVSLVSIDRVTRGAEGTGEGASFAMRLLACVVVPNDPFNPDKKPVSLVHNALVVAHDAKGVLLYDLASLVPAAREAGAEGEEEEEEAKPLCITEAAPLAEWELPARVNDLQANRVNLIQAKASSHRRSNRGTTDAGGAASPPATTVKALLLDFVVVAAAVQDKTVRLASFRLRRDYGDYTTAVTPEPLPAPAEVAGPTSTPAPGRQEAGRIDDMVRAPLSFLAGNILTADDLGLPFKPLASSFRLVRLFGLENLTAWPGAVESARRRATQFSLSLAPDAVNRALPVASLLLVAYDQHSNQSFLVGHTLHTSLVMQDAVPWRRTLDANHGADHGPSSCDGTPAKTRSPSKRRATKEQPILSFQLAPCVSASPVAKDCISCLASAHDTTAAAECTEGIRRNPFGAAVPLRWIAGTVDGWLVRIHGQEASTEHGVAIAMTSAQTRPVVAPASLKKKYPPLHKEPITAVAVSSGNDVLSTDLAQNVAISTLPFTLMPATHARGGAPERPAVMQQKRPGMELFPVPRGRAGEARALGLVSSPARIVALALVFGSLLGLVVFLIAMH